LWTDLPLDITAALSLSAFNAYHLGLAKALYDDDDGDDAGLNAGHFFWTQKF